MPIRRATLAIFFLLICAHTLIWAQQRNGEIHGRVLGSRDGQPVAQVQIQLADARIRAVTADDGGFALANIPPGTYVLQAAAVGYRLAFRNVTIAAGESASIDLILTSSTADRTDSINVSAGAFDVATEPSASAVTLEGDERKNTASVLADDPLRAVQSMPGVSSNNDFSSEFSLRGAPFRRVGLYLDGILLHSPFHTTDGQADDGSLTIFNGDLAGEITLFEGAWPVKYSDRSAGIVAVETRSGDRDQTHWRAEASASNASLLAEGPLGKNRGSWIVAVRKSYLQYILNRIDFGDQAPLSFGFTDGEAHLVYDLTTRHNVSFTYIDGASSVDRSTFHDTLPVNSVMDSGFRYSLATAASRYAPNGRVLLTNRVAWTRERGDVANRDELRLSHDAYGEWTWRGDVSVVWGGSNTLDAGGVFRRMRDDGSSTRIVYTPVLVTAGDLFRGTGRIAGGYAQQRFSFLSGKVSAIAGVRSDESSRSPIAVTSPYGSVSLTPWSTTRVQFDWGQYAQFPELSQLFSLFVHGLLLPERATHYEAAIEQKLDDHTRLRVEFYDRQDHDLLASPLLDPRMLVDGSIVPALASAPLRNTERGYSRGMQIFLQRRSANGFTGWISYAYGRTMLRDGDLGVAFPSDYDQTHTVNGFLSRRLRPTVNLSARITYGSGMPLPGFYRLDSTGYLISQNRNGLRAPAYERTDLRLNKAYIHKQSKTTLFAEVVNITNRHNRDFDSPGPYDGATGRAYPNFFSMFPILPSAGVLVEF